MKQLLNARSGPRRRADHRGWHHAGPLLLALLTPAGAAQAAVPATVPGQAVRVTPAVINPDANGLVAFSIRAEGIPAPGLRSFALQVRFGGAAVALVPSVNTLTGPPPAADKVTCAVELATAGASALRSGDILLATSGFGNLLLDARQTGNLLFTVNGLVGGTTDLARYNAGVGGPDTTPLTGDGSLIDFRCVVGAAVPPGTRITVTPELYPDLPGAILLAETFATPIIDHLVAGAIEVPAAANRAPQIVPVADQTVAAGATLDIPLSATDPDGDAIVLAVAFDQPSQPFLGPMPIMPSFCTLTDNGDGTGRIRCQPGTGAAGSYQVAFTATDNRTPPLSSTEEFQLTVTSAPPQVNRAPELAPIGDRTVAEGATLNIPLAASDPDGHPVTFSASGLPGFCQLAGAAITCQPGFDAAGAYPVTVTASDNGQPPLADSETFTLTVTNVNRAPELAAIGEQALTEGANGSITLAATDPDGNAVAFSATGLPGFCQLAGSAIDCAPGFDAAGSYSVAVTASDDGQPPMTDSETFTLAVSNVNRPPELTVDCPPTARTGLPLTCEVSATDPDDDAVRLAAADLPTGAQFSDNLDGTGELTWTPAEQQVGAWQLRFIATDDGQPALQDQFQADISVEIGNRRPVLAEIGPQEGPAGALIELTLTATDPDTVDVLRFSTGNLPDGATLTDNGNGTARFNWTPGPAQFGEHRVLFRVADNGAPVLTDDEEVTFTIAQVNRPPVLNPIGDRDAREGLELVVDLVASDPDEGDVVTITCDLGQLTNANCEDHGDGTGVLRWTPSFEDAGAWTVTVEVTDSAEPPASDMEQFNITVGDVNRPPALDPIGNRQAYAGQPWELLLTAQDPDGDPLVFSVNGLPAGAELIDNGDGTASILWTPPANGLGPRQLEVVVSDQHDPPDDPQQDRESFRITVLPAPVPPVTLGQIPDQNGAENQPLRVAVRVANPDGRLLHWTLPTAPAGAMIVPTGDGTAEIRWTPPCGSVGEHAFSVRAAALGTRADGRFSVRVQGDGALGYVKPDYRLVATRNIGLLQREDTLAATLVSQNGCVLPRVRANLRVPADAGITVMDAQVMFSNIPGQGEKAGDDTFVVRYNRLLGLDTGLFDWAVGRP